jgi:hypothetical protein
MLEFSQELTCVQYIPAYSMSSPTVTEPMPREKENGLWI